MLLDMQLPLAVLYFLPFVSFIYPHSDISLQFLHLGRLQPIVLPYLLFKEMYLELQSLFLSDEAVFFVYSNLSTNLLDISTLETESAISHRELSLPKVDITLITFENNCEYFPEF